MNAIVSDSARTVPAKVVIERRPRPGAEFALIEWIERLTQTAARAEGHEGTSVLAADNARFILVRFASQAQLDYWQLSAEYEQLIREADAFSVAGDREQIQSGFETWFTLPDRPRPAAPPPKWKMALVTWLCLFPIVIAMSFLTAPLHWSLIPRTAISTAVPTALLTWLLMPRLTRLLYPWLYNRQPADQ
jgi:uncharacterized protein